MKITLDFETRSEVDLKKTGAWVYAIHPSTQVLCIAFKCGDSPHTPATIGPDFVDGELEEYAYETAVFQKLIKLADDPDVIFEAHNASFEYAIWHNIMHKRHGFPDIPIERWRCSASVAAYKSMPRALGKLCEALDTEHQKDEEGKFVMYRMCKPVPEKYQEAHGKWYESDKDFETLIKYCIDDVKTEHECSEILGELPPSELKLWLLDFKINQYGVQIDIPLAKAASEVKEKIKDIVKAECKELVGFYPGQVSVIKEFVKGHNIELPTKKDKKTGIEKETLGAEVLKTLLAREDVPEIVKSVCRLRQDFSTISLSKYDAAINASDSEGIVRGQFLYHGASTGRWSGKIIQLHNLPRGNFDESSVGEDMQTCCSLIKDRNIEAIDSYYSLDMRLMEVLKSCLRGMIIPRDGRLLRVCDLSQIEARVLPWLAGEEAVLQNFRDGKDLYKFTAAQIYRKLYEEIDKAERFIGKTASLALGYQGGPGAFMAMALNFGVIIEKDEANKIKAEWRDRNKRIVKFWYNLEKGAIKAVGTGQAVRVHGKIVFKMQGEYLTMVLPSGRCLWYYQPIVKKKMIEATKGGKFSRPSLTYMGSDSARNIQWGRVHTYGGRLAENATQAASRDLLAIGMRRLDHHGYTVIGHVHDEIITEDDPKHGSMEEMVMCMTKPPKWAKGLPIDADGFETERYYKG